MKKILIIEDDIALNKGINKTLSDKEIEVTSVFNLKEAREKLYEKYNLIILDINFPDGSGLELLKEIREYDETPVIILTANDMEKDEIMGLEMGANDYITKPFSLNILKVRVSNQIRKYRGNEKYRFGNLSLDFENLKFFKGKEEIRLNKIEQKLLKYLVENKNITLTKEKILDHIWTYSGEYVFENTLSVNIKRLRDKIKDDPKEPKYINTVYGIGYFWEDEK